MNEGQIVDGVEFQRVSVAPGYWITNVGSFWAEDGDKLREVETFVHRTGYLRKTVKVGEGEYVALQMHALVLTAFVGPKPGGTECCHWDGDKTNNRLENLRWDTKKANGRDKVRLGESHRPIGSTNHWATLNESDAATIKDRLHLGESGVEIAKDFNVDPCVVSHIKSGRSWTHVAWPTGSNVKPNRREAFTDDEVAEMIRLSRNGVSAGAMGRQYGVSTQTICNVLNGKYCWSKFDRVAPNAEDPVNATCVARHFGVSERTVLQWYKDGIIPGFQMPNGGRRRFYLKDVAPALASRRRLPA